MTRISELIRDPFVKAAFERAERDGSAGMARLPERRPDEGGGAAVKARGKLETC